MSVRADSAECWARGPDKRYCTYKQGHKGAHTFEVYPTPAAVLKEQLEKLQGAASYALRALETAAEYERMAQIGLKTRGEVSDAAMHVLSTAATMRTAAIRMLIRELE